MTDRYGTALLAIALWVLAAAVAVAAPVEPMAAVEIEFFTRPGCPHCAEAREFLEALQRRHPQVHVIERDLRRDPEARARLRALAAEHREAPPGVPAFRIDGMFFIGFDTAATTGARIEARVTASAPPQTEPGDGGSCIPDAIGPCLPEAEAGVTLFGVTFSPQRYGLPLFTVFVGLVDGFNPCSIWVLVFMLAMLAPMRDRPRMLAVAGTFVVVEGLAYFAFMTAWLNTFVLIGVSRISELVLAAIAWIAGAIHVKDFFAFGRGVSLSIPAAARTRIYARVRDIVTRRSVAAAVAATVVLAVLVQVVEFMCTAGLPALYTRILTLRPMEWWSYYGYMLLYIVMYMLDDAVVLGVGVVTLSRRRLQEREGRWLKLVSGTVMIALGIYLFAR